MRPRALHVSCLLASLALGANAFAANIDAFRTTEANELRQAARSVGVSIETGKIAIVSLPGLTFAGASITGLEDIPATRLANGVDFGFVHVSASEFQELRDLDGHVIPNGFYTARVMAPVSSLGEFDARVHLIDGQGMVAAILGATVQVSSLNIPPDRNPAARTAIAGGIGPVNLVAPTFAVTPGTSSLIFPWYICPNGWLVCFGVPVFRLPGFIDP